MAKFNNLLNSSYVQTSIKDSYKLVNDNTIQENKPVEAPTQTQNTNQPVTEVKTETRTVETPAPTVVENRAPIKVESPVTETVKEEKKEEVITNNDSNSEINSLKEQINQLTASLKELQADKEAREKADTEAKTKSKRELIESYVTLDSCNGNEEERAKRIASLMYIPDADLKTFLETHYILPETPCSKVKQASARRIRVTDFSEQPQLEQSKIKQAGILDENGANKARVGRILQFVNSSSNAGGRFS